MTLTQEGVRNRGQQLRLWLGVVIVILQLLTRLGLPVVAPEKTIFGVLAGPIGGLAVLLWWLLLSRAYWAERLGAVGVIVVAMFGTYRVLDESIAKGAEHYLFPMLAIP
jgi:hypothetical protein